MGEITKGPWVECEYGGGWIKDVVEYAGCGSHEAERLSEENKRLVMAAPELLEDAVRRVRECGDCNGTGRIRKPHGFFIVEADCPTCSQTRAIIAKATQP